jgi:PHP family Zn ribbon phosphoesterase
MNPRQIVDRARERGLDIIAITDHNSAENVEATRRAAKGTGITVWGGMEITSSEEVHILALFEGQDALRRMQDMVYDSLPARENDEKTYGHQVIVNEFKEVLGFNTRLLIAATGLNARRILDEIALLGGISVASHIDRQAFSVLSQLGFIPEDLRFDALELSPNVSKAEAEAKFASLKRFPWVSFSDAHHITDIGRKATTLLIKEPTLDEMRQALADGGGRNLTWE